MYSAERASGRGTMQHRLTVANWWHGISLRTRLTVSVALSVALVMSLVIVAGTRLAQQLLDNDLRETARVTVVAVADDVELRLEPEPDTIVPVLHDFIAAAPSLRSISVFRADGGGSVTPIASTSSSPYVPASLVARAIRDAEPVWDETEPHIARVAAPIRQNSRMVGAVVVSVSLTPVEQLQRGGRLLGAAGMMAAIAGITLLIHLLAGRLIHVPLGDIAGAMTRVTNGDLTVRAPVHRHDEIGYLAARLNEMLAELETLHRSLNERVEAATGELRQRNDQLVRSYESVLQLRQTVARAEQLAAVGQTMANVAHQIGTPLNLVSGHVQLLKQEVTDPVLQRRLRIVEEQIERVASSVRSLLERVRPDADRRPVDIPRLLNRLADAVRPRFAAAGIRLDVKIAAGLPTVLADETALELALLNLMTNAVDAMPGGGVLSIDAARGPAGPHIEIRDTGTGIAPDLLPRIFDPWVTTKRDGTGLGLSVTRDVVERLGGTIRVVSSIGAGARFTIELPTSGADPGNDPTQGSDPGARATQGSNFVDRRSAAKEASTS